MAHTLGREAIPAILLQATAAPYLLNRPRKNVETLLSQLRAITGTAGKLSQWTLTGRMNRFFVTIQERESNQHMGKKMTPKDFRTLLEYHGLSQNGFAKLAKVNERQVRRWADLRRSQHPLPLGAEARIRQALNLHGNGMSSE